jgi:hypothetical protein
VAIEGFYRCRFPVPIQFPFSLSQTKLIGIGNIFDNRQHTVNCSLRFFFYFFVLFTGTRNDQTIEIMTGQLEPPESWNDRKAEMTGKLE